MKEYKNILAKAVQCEDDGLWAEASKNYAAAGKILLDKIPDLNPSERFAAKSTVKKLLDLASTMDKYAKEQRSPGAKKSGGKGAKSREASLFTPMGKTGVRFDDIIGQKEAKQIINDSIVDPAKYPELYKKLKINTNGGILLYGPPGTGKTMIGQAIATEIDADFFYIRLSDVLEKYFGEAEQRIRALFETARASGNAIIFFDEMESLAVNRGGTDMQAMNRVVTEMLGWMDGFLKNEGRLIVIGATNRPWDIDSAFLRYPRLSHHVFVDLPDEEAREDMLKKKLEGIPCAENIDYAAIAAKCKNFSGADIANLCNSAKLAAKNRMKQAGTTGGEGVMLTAADFAKALTMVRSSIREKDLKQLRDWAGD